MKEEVELESQESDEDLNKKDNKNKNTKLINLTIKREPYKPLEEKKDF